MGELIPERESEDTVAESVAEGVPQSSAGEALSGPKEVSRLSQSSWPAPADTTPEREGSLVGGLVRMVRPHQWVKNVFVLAPVVFAKEIFAPELLVRAGSAFAVFCLLAGAVYTLNDIADVAADRLHPVKRFRPIASGRVPLGIAKAVAAALVVVSLGWGAVLSPSFAAVAAAYFALNIAYTKRLKHVAYLDVACISAGFVLRVVGGGYAARIDVSWYLFACTALLALFLGFGKRRHELTTASARAGKQRLALEGYTKRGLDWALLVTSACTTTAYLVYTLDAETQRFFRTEWLWPSTGLVVLGIWRFLFLVRNRPKAESPTQEMLSDGPFVAIVFGWAVLVMWLVYHLQPGG